MSVEIRRLASDDFGVLERVAEGVFDGPIQARWTRVFLADARHHLFVAIDAGVVVGMVSAVDYVHPDKAPQLWINEIGVAPSHQRRGIGRQLLNAMLEHGRSIGCTEAWLGAEDDNVPARALYASAGSTAETFVLYSFALAPEDTPNDSAPDLQRLERMTDVGSATRSSPMLRRRGAYLALAAGTIAIGLVVHWWGEPLGSTMRDVLGDALWAAMIVWLASAIAPGARLVARGGAALALCFAIEVSQRFHSPALDAIRATAAGQLVLGSGFDPRDFLAYAAGVGAAMYLEHVRR